MPPSAVKGPVECPPSLLDWPASLPPSVPPSSTQLSSWWHTPAPLQVSVVQAFESSQDIGVPLHTPFAQVSVEVHPSRSSQATVFDACMQAPVAASQLSVVQTFESLQSFAVPGLHTPSLHVSLLVQRSRSSQGAVLKVCPQPVAGEQLAVVQTFESSGQTTGVETQLPAEQ